MEDKQNQQEKMYEAKRYTENNREILRQTRGKEMCCGCYSCGSTFESGIVKTWGSKGRLILQGHRAIVEWEDGTSELLSSHRFGLVGKGVAPEKLNTDQMVQGIEKGSTALCPICGRASVISMLSLVGEVEGLAEFSKYLNQVNKYYNTDKPVDFKGIAEKDIKPYGIKDTTQVNIDLRLLERVYGIMHQLVYEGDINGVMRNQYGKITEIEAEINNILEKV